MTYSAEDLQVLEKLSVRYLITDEVEHLRLQTVYHDVRKDTPKLTKDGQNPGNWLNAIRTFGERLSGDINRYGYEKLTTEQHRALSDLAFKFVSGTDTPEETHRKFLELKPFTEKNEIMGYFVWAMATYKKTGVWPKRLPPKT